MTSDLEAHFRAKYSLTNTWALVIFVCRKHNTEWDPRTKSGFYVKCET